MGKISKRDSDHEARVVTPIPASGQLNASLFGCHISLTATPLKSSPVAGVEDCSAQVSQPRQLNQLCDQFNNLNVRRSSQGACRKLVFSSAIAPRSAVLLRKLASLNAGLRKNAVTGSRQRGLLESKEEHIKCAADKDSADQDVQMQEAERSRPFFGP